MAQRTLKESIVIDMIYERLQYLQKKPINQYQEKEITFLKRLLNELE